MTRRVRGRWDRVATGSAGPHPPKAPKPNRPASAASATAAVGKSLAQPGCAPSLVATEGADPAGKRHVRDGQADSSR